MAAACSNVSLAGFGTSLSCGVTASSAKEPVSHVPMTSSPALKRVTLGPTASTVPARSHPRTRTFGPRNPIIGRAR